LVFFFLYHIHGAFYTYERLGINAVALYMGLCKYSTFFFLFSIGNT
jgi:hypothetical protein